MKVAISSSGRDLESAVDQRFGRCPYFAIVETDDMSFEVFENESAALGGGAGIQSAQFVAAKGAKAVITGNCGPNAVNTLLALGLELFVDLTGSVRNSIMRFKNGEIKAAKEASVPEFFGIGSVGPNGKVQSQPAGKTTGMEPGQGRGMGGGMGGCRGMGIGRGGGGGRGKGAGGGKNF